MSILRELQQEFLDLRFGMFLHFNMATYQDREWGDPRGAVEAFDPTNLDTDQWAAAARSAGMRYACLTAKHHDGFCIWPTATTKDRAEIDVVRAYADSFRRAGLKIGLYYSILDLRADIRHHNVTPEKIELIKDQLIELLTSYGKIDLLIFDGWDAPWSRITYDEVPFHEIYRLVKELQPECLISELNASQYPDSALYYTDIKAFEQNAGQMLPNDSHLPAQSCVTLTDGWFWKEADKDADLKPVKQIVGEWLIPQNERHCNLILNAPPNREGRLAPNVIHRLEEIGRMWKHGGPAPKVNPPVVITTPNLATGRPIAASSSADTIGPDMANDGNFRSAWSPDEGETSGWLEVDLGRLVSFNTLVLAGEGIDSYRFIAGSNDLVASTLRTPVAIHQVERAEASRIRVWVEGPQIRIAEIGIYEEP
jgi:alpha-L-fucosidase